MSDREYLEVRRNPNYNQELVDELEEREREAERLEERIWELEAKVDDLEYNLTNSISIDWLKQWDKEHRDEWNIGYTIEYIIKDWKKENEKL